MAGVEVVPPFPLLTIPRVALSCVAVFTLTYFAVALPVLLPASLGVAMPQLDFAHFTLALVQISTARWTDGGVYVAMVAVSIARQTVQT